jgi:hypothetical protein
MTARFLQEEFGGAKKEGAFCFDADRKKPFRSAADARKRLAKCANGT